MYKLQAVPLVHTVLGSKTVNMAVASNTSMLPAGRKDPESVAVIARELHGKLVQIVKKRTVSRSTLDRVDRASFSSVKENNSGVAQSFTDSKTSSYLRHQFYLAGEEEEEAIDDGTSSGRTTPQNGAVEGREDVMLPLTNPNTLLHGFVCPCDGFRGWKQISIGGKIASKSSGDLRRLAGGWEWDMKVETVAKRSPAKVKGQRCPPGESPLERLPMELLGELSFWLLGISEL